MQFALILFERRRLNQLWRHVSYSASVPSYKI